MPRSVDWKKLPLIDVNTNHVGKIHFDGSENRLYESPVQPSNPKVWARMCVEIESGVLWDRLNSGSGPRPVNESVFKPAHCRRRRLRLPFSYFPSADGLTRLIIPSAMIEQDYVPIYKQFPFDSAFRYDSNRFHPVIVNLIAKP